MNAERSSSKSQWMMWLVLAVCAAPVIASYALYFWVRPDGRTNYGELLEPQRDLPAIQLKSVDGSSAEWTQWRGRWILLTTAPGECPADCVQRLYVMRQVRLTTGKDQDRVERVWLLTNDQAPDPALIAQHPGLQVLRPQSAGADLGITDLFQPGHIFVVDPLGHVMMRFPLDVDPNRMKKDIARLLRASRVG
jgi:hypothetical protein